MLKASETLTVVEARIDWISCSGRNGEGASALKIIGGRGITQSQKMGDRVKSFGTHGWYGSSCGHWKIAQKEEEVMIQVGGDEADAWALTLASYADHMSRIDYCVTVQEEKPSTDRAEQVYDFLEYQRKIGKSRLTAKEIKQTKGGQGVQIGARASAYVGRIYDKHAETKGLYPSGCWRYEVEMKKHASENEHVALMDSIERRDQAGRIVQTVFGRFGVEVPFDEGTKVQLLPIPKRIRDADRSLEWLRVQVAPTVRWLGEIGRGEEALAALGLVDIERAKGA